MAVEFYMLPFSHPCRAVWMTLEALGIKYEVHITDIMKGEHKTDEFAKVNSTQTIPAIRDGDFSMGESRAIATYLCSRYGDTNKTLYPRDAKSKAKVDMHLYIDEDMQQKIQQYVNVPGVFFRGEKTKLENVHQVKAVLDAYEKFLTSHKFIACDHLTIADFFVYITLGLLSLTEYDDYADFPKVVAWKRKIEDLPYHKKTCEDPLSKVRQMYRAKQE